MEDTAIQAIRPVQPRHAPSWRSLARSAVDHSLNFRLKSPQDAKHKSKLHRKNADLVYSPWGRAMLLHGMEPA